MGRVRHGRGSVTSYGYLARHGYWSYIVVAKGDHTLAAHPAVAAFGDGVSEDHPRGAWREIWMYSRYDYEVDISAVVAATGAPAMAFYVMDEDCAIGEGATPSGRRWEGVFTEECVLSDYPDALPDGYRREDAVAGAVVWAAEAGLTTDPAKIEHAFAHGWLHNLCDAVGLPDTADAAAWPETTEPSAVPKP